MVLVTPRLYLQPVSLAVVEAVLSGDRMAAERASGARFPESWPGRAVVERSFYANLESIRLDPAKRLWGDRLMISREGERRVIGSVVFNGRPDEDGVAEIGYGVEDRSQGQGLGTEATRACVSWALAEPGVVGVRAKTFPWHRASVRVIEKIGMQQVDTCDHDLMGEMLVFEIRDAKSACAA